MHVGSRGRGAIQGEQTLQAGQPLQGVRYPGPDELRTEVCDIVQEKGSKIIPKKNKCKKAKWLSEEA